MSEKVQTGQPKKGRPTKSDVWLTERGLLRVEGWARDGLSDKQIAANMGITTSTFYEWKNKYPLFSDAVKFGKEEIDRMVENALLKSALGYKYEEEVVTKDGITTIEKQQHPNQSALKLWLVNRKPQVWRDKQDISINNSMLELTEEERHARINELKGKLEGNRIVIE